MATTMRERIKQWVVICSHTTNPYGRYWSASTTLGIDVNGEGATIEEAYNDLTDIIYNSATYTRHLMGLQTFKALNPDL